MAALKLHIKELKYRGAYMGNDDESSRRARLSSLLAFFKPKPTPQSDLDIPKVRLLWLVGKSARHFEKPWQKDPTTSSSHYRIAEFYGRLAEATVDYHFDPGTDYVDLAQYVNHQAFLSLIMDGASGFLRLGLCSML
ncbi:hypothetical protein VE01_03160 [Pseudogymnoascus verrucosus]|uniref:Uncharacterized protein n=1 Tax=Pseudogymnoascus verrucosus TaxID=342668 RepID=A0A1B8GR28_9PEZI|nr:uncharacterized protein VE01_03160 [Pseudogymnoascus verrucosus]OBT98289.1 hypothetical protein VE01_03160 [Pseudogymnoascus verrucosus]